MIIVAIVVIVLIALISAPFMKFELSDPFAPYLGWGASNSYVLYGVTGASSSLRALKVSLQDRVPNKDSVQINYYFFTSAGIISTNAFTILPRSSLSFDMHNMVMDLRSGNLHMLLERISSDWNTWHLIVEDSRVDLDVVLRRGPIYFWTKNIFLINMDALDTTLQGTFTDKTSRTTETVSGMVNFDHWVVTVPIRGNPNTSVLTPNPSNRKQITMSFYEVTYWQTPNGPHATVLWARQQRDGTYDVNLASTITGILSEESSPTLAVSADTMDSGCAVLPASWTVAFNRTLSYTSTIHQYVLQNGIDSPTSNQANIFTQGNVTTPDGAFQGYGFLEYSRICV